MYGRRRRLHENRRETQGTLKGFKGPRSQPSGSADRQEVGRGLGSDPVVGEPRGVHIFAGYTAFIFYTKQGARVLKLLHRRLKEGMIRKKSRTACALRTAGECSIAQRLVDLGTRGQVS